MFEYEAQLKILAHTQKDPADLQHELHADPVFYQPHHQVCLTLEHLVILPRQCVGVFNGEVKVGSWTKKRRKFKIQQMIWDLYSEDYD